MAKWQPPIPAGALYSKAARALGPALPLLAYCYDLVQRDGWFDLSLKDATSDMEESYQTIKRYWWALKDGPFFAEIEDHGRKGWRVRFKNVWIDWRVLNARVSSDPFSRSDEGTEVNLETTEEIPSGTQGQLKVNSRSDEGTEKYPEQNVYGTHDSDQADIAARAKSATALPASQRRKPPERTPERQAYLDRKKAIEQAYVAELGYTPAAFGKEAKSSKWLAEQGYTPEQVVKCYRHLQRDDFYARQHISLATISKQIGVMARNGQRAPPGDLDLVHIDPSTRQTPEERRAAAERFKVILEESRSAGK